MGLFSSLKNMVTGGGAAVTVNVSEATIGKPFKVSVSIDVKEGELKANHVYFRIQCEAKNTDFVIGYLKAEDGSQTDKLEITKEQNTKLIYNEEEKVAQEAVYNEGQQYTLSKEITLPAVCMPTAEGMITWKIYAGVDTRGNDPDSGWQTFTVNK